MVGPVSILAFDELDSSNAEAKRRAADGETGPLWITAKRQTAGRGRRGRSWSTEAGNLAATLLMTTGKPAAEAAQTSFVAALALAETIETWVPAALVSIKWPNDVLIDGKKASGILIESGAFGENSLWLAIGCGLNLAHAPRDVERPSARVADHLRIDVSSPPTAEEAMAIFARRMAHWLSVWEAACFAPIAQAWTARARGIGDACTARLGHETLEGVAEGLEADGALRLRLSDGQIRRITAGDVFFAAA